MPSKRQQKLKKIGTLPGTPLYTGQCLNEKTRIESIQYDEKSFSDTTSFEKISENHNNWILVTGLNDIEVLKKIAEKFDLHSLVLEDILHVHQRPKAEPSDENLFVTLHGFSFTENILVREQFSFILEKNCLITFCENEKHPFENIRKRIEVPESKLRKKSVQYLLYTLLDRIIDQYFVIVHAFEEQLEELNQKIMTEEHSKRLQDLHKLKTDILSFRKNITPLNEVLGVLKEYFPGKDRVYWQDLKDHTLQVLETSKSHLESTDGLFNLYFSMVGLRTNKIMQNLTIITFIFLPLGLIAGIYGMNFVHMPELKWIYGYPMVVTGMIAIVLLILYFFKRKRWF